ncbi:MAG: NADH-quinone oxidoreductase subunit K [Candidatus Dormibacteraeota bacterium]|nr:NADH-quinone oxidoreductase subunit K [Candidatus Dormibacteraeota bacterium]MBV8444343.1 NADH-quinone oxidoreductase subunit K [Candidatus Dormibacteraeota bacterium]
MNAGPGQFAVLSTIVFGIGLFGVLSRRTTAGLLMALFLLTLAPVIALVGFAHFGATGPIPPVGDAFALIAVLAAVAETVLGASLALLGWRRLRSVAAVLDGEAD